MSSPREHGVGHGEEADEGLDDLVRVRARDRGRDRVRVRVRGTPRPC